ncbi:hypothetical protein KIPB_016221, partial [Kipferlia bialata]
TVDERERERVLNRAMEREQEREKELREGGAAGLASEDRELGIDAAVDTTSSSHHPTAMREREREPEGEGEREPETDNDVEVEVADEGEGDATEQGKRRRVRKRDKKPKGKRSRSNRIDETSSDAEHDMVAVLSASLYGLKVASSERSENGLDGLDDETPEDVDTHEPILRLLPG